MKSLEKSWYKYLSFYTRGGVLRYLGEKIYFFLLRLFIAVRYLFSQIGSNIKFGHRGIGIVIHEKSVIGDNVHIMQ